MDRVAILGGFFPQFFKGACFVAGGFYLGFLCRLDLVLSCCEVLSSWSVRVGRGLRDCYVITIFG